MASTKEYLDFILEQLQDLDDVTYRAMMGEYILYYKGRIAGGIYDNRLLIKPVSSACNYLSPLVYAVPYAGAKEMLLVEEIEDRAYLTGLFEAIEKDLPMPKKKKR